MVLLLQSAVTLPTFSWAGSWNASSSLSWSETWFFCLSSTWTWSSCVLIWSWIFCLSWNWTWSCVLIWTWTFCVLGISTWSWSSSLILILFSWAHLLASALTSTAPRR